MQLVSRNLATARIHRDWLRALPRVTGKSLTALAEEVGVARSTLTRPLRQGDTGASTLNAATIEKIVTKFGVPMPGTPPAAVALRRMFLAEDASPYEIDKKDPLAAAITALIAGKNSVTPWTLRTRSLELMGFLPGDVVLVDLSNTEPQPGDAVCAQVYDWPKMKADTVMRVFERAGGVKLLLPRSLDPALQAPLQVDDDHVVVKGVILWHRLRPVAAP